MSWLEALQGASNAAASNVSGPVDAIAWLLRMAGVPVQKPVGGSEWMAEKGLTKPTEGVSGLLGEAAGMSAPIAVAAKAPQIAAGLLKMGENAAAPSTLGAMGQRGAIDTDAILGAIQEHKARLLDEAKDWSTRKYKPNQMPVFFEGGGPGPESMKIGSINESRRHANVNSRLDQIRVLNTLSDNVRDNPARVEALYWQARREAEETAARNGWPLEQTLDARIGQLFAGMKDSSFGPNSVGGAIRRAIEGKISQSSSQAASAPGADDFLTQLFGGQ